MRLRLSDPALAPCLLAHLRKRLDCIAADDGGGTIVVSLLGSRHVTENVVELEQRLEPWRAANGGVRVELRGAA